MSHVTESSIELNYEINYQQIFCALLVCALRDVLVPMCCASYRSLVVHNYPNSTTIAVYIYNNESEDDMALAITIRLISLSDIPEESE